MSASSVAGEAVNMDDFIDNEEDDVFSTFEQELFGEQPLDDEPLAPILEEDENEDEAVNLALAAADSAEAENEDTAVQRENDAEAVAEDILSAASALMALKESKTSWDGRPQRLVTTQEYQQAQEAKRQAQAANFRAKAPKRRQFSKNVEAKIDKVVGDTVSVWSRGTIAKKFLVPGIRLEELPADTQARIIHGDDNFKNAKLGEACCALCGFKFRDRGSMRSGKVKDSAISYDHFIPINFAAIIFRIVSSAGKYSDAEFKILRSIGDMVCWHCNYSKGQSMFITCPIRVAGSFEGLKVNEPVIRKFFKDLLTSKSKWAYNTPQPPGSPNTSLSKCIGTDTNWLESRVSTTIRRANEVIKLIKDNVDFAKAKDRLGMARATVRRTLEGLEGNAKWQELQREVKNPEGNAAKCMKDMLALRRKLVAKAFATEEIAYPPPWKTDLAGNEDNSTQPFTPVICYQPRQPKRGREEYEQQDTKRQRVGGKRRKTRRHRLPKLL
jgi:hypothetical protein